MLFLVGAALVPTCTNTWVDVELGSGASPGASAWAFSARTLDDEKLYMATLEANPRGLLWKADAPGPDGAGRGMHWENKYGFVGVTWDGEMPGVYDDGLNEHGLSVAQNQLDETIYPPVTEPSRAIGMRAVVAWLLGGAANVTEARQLLGSSGAQIWGRAGGGPGGDSGAERQHLHILDLSGESLLAEWTGGALHLYGKEEGGWRTVTNSPDFPTQRAMREYWTMPGTSLAMSLDGTPAAYDSLGRQRRISLMNQVRPRLNTTAQGVAWSFKLLDTIAVPGVAGFPESVAGAAVPSDGPGDFTQWQLVRDHSKRVLYCRTWDNLLPKRVALADCKLGRGEARVALGQMGGGAWYGDF